MRPTEGHCFERTFTGTASSCMLSGACVPWKLQVETITHIPIAGAATFI